MVLLPLLIAPRRHNRLIFRVWVLPIMTVLKWCCGIDYEIRGLEYMPTTPCIVASKHQSAWETMILPVLLPYPALILKKELLRLPFFGLYLQRFGMIAIDRSQGIRALRDIADKAKAALATGRHILIFPEGTRTVPGAEPHYHRGILPVYSGAGVPVVPIALNSGLFWGRNAFLKQPGTIVLQFLPPIPSGLDKNTFMTCLEDAIETHSEALRQEAQGAATASAG